MTCAHGTLLRKRRGAWAPDAAPAPAGAFLQKRRGARVARGTPGVDRRGEFGDLRMRGATSSRAPYGEPCLALFERRLCRRNRILGEASEGAVEAPSEVG